MEKIKWIKKWDRETNSLHYLYSLLKPMLKSFTPTTLIIRQCLIKSYLRFLVLMNEPFCLLKYYESFYCSFWIILYITLIFTSYNCLFRSSRFNSPLLLNLVDPVVLQEEIFRSNGSNRKIVFPWIRAECRSWRWFQSFSHQKIVLESERSGLHHPGIVTFQKFNQLEYPPKMKYLTQWSLSICKF